MKDNPENPVTSSDPVFCGQTQWTPEKATQWRKRRTDQRTRLLKVVDRPIEPDSEILLMTTCALLVTLLPTLTRPYAETLGNAPQQPSQWQTQPRREPNPDPDPDSPIVASQWQPRPTAQPSQTQWTDRQPDRQTQTASWTVTQQASWNPAQPWPNCEPTNEADWPNDDRLTDEGKWLKLTDDWTMTDRRDDPDPVDEIEQTIESPDEDIIDQLKWPKDGWQWQWTVLNDGPIIGNEISRLTDPMDNGQTMTQPIVMKRLLLMTDGQTGKKLTLLTIDGKPDRPLTVNDGPMTDPDDRQRKES